MGTDYQTSALTFDSLSSHGRQAHSWRLLRRGLPVAMLIVLLLGLVGGLRMGLALGQPLPGFVLMWRKDLKMLVVSWATPPHWPALATGQMEVNDRILCIDGYHPSPNSIIYGLEPRYDGIECENGSRDYLAIFRERFASSDPAVAFLVDREGMLLKIPEVRLIGFTPLMLVEAFLPVLVMGLGLLTIAAIVYRADPRAEVNLIFALFATLISTLVWSQAYVGKFSDRWSNPGIIALIMTAPWLPLVGVVSFHLVGLLTDQPAFSAFVHRILRPYYVLSLAFSALGLFVYSGIAESAAIVPNQLYTVFSAASCLFAWGWGVLCLIWTTRRSSSKRIRRTAILVLVSLIILIGFVAPILASVFLNISATRFIYSTPYLALAFVALLAYAILRYQLFTAKSTVLVGLLLVIFCIVIADIVYLTVGQAAGFLPILAATLITAAALEARRGPTTFFTRLLRRETLDYGAVARFGQQVGALQRTEALIQATWDCLARDLEVAHLKVWLLDEDLQMLDHFSDGQPTGRVATPAGFSAQLTAHPDALRAGPLADSLYASWFTVEHVMLWVPMVDRGQVVGLLGLGPRWTGELYDEPDVQLIGILAHRLALAILSTRQFERLQTMSHLVLQAEENERRKIARELHDTVLQFLLVLTYGLDDLRERQAAPAGEIERWQDRISAEASQLRDLLSYLRAPELLVQQGLIPSLRSWLERTRQETTAVIDPKLDEAAESLLATETKVAIYRVCREAVHNAVKHAQANRITVRLGRDGQRVVLVVEDNGQGFDVAQALEPKAKGYSSLQDMRIYMESMGGRLEVYSTPGMGTTIDAWVPSKAA
jgi:signal transduction histidine kinase